MGVIAAESMAAELFAQQIIQYANEGNIKAQISRPLLGAPPVTNTESVSML